jgi:hypothetical protein
MRPSALRNHSAATLFGFSPSSLRLPSPRFSFSPSSFPPSPQARDLERRLEATQEAETKLAAQMAFDMALKERESLRIRGKLDKANRQLQAYQIDCQQLRGQIYVLSNSRGCDRGGDLDHAAIGARVT